MSNNTIPQDRFSNQKAYLQDGREPDFSNCKNGNKHESELIERINFCAQTILGTTDLYKIAKEDLEAKNKPMASSSSSSSTIPAPKIYSIRFTFYSDRLFAHALDRGNNLIPTIKGIFFDLQEREKKHTQDAIENANTIWQHHNNECASSADQQPSSPINKQQNQNNNINNNENNRPETPSNNGSDNENDEVNQNNNNENNRPETPSSHSSDNENDEVNQNNNNENNHSEAPNNDNSHNENEANQSNNNEDNHSEAPNEDPLNDHSFIRLDPISPRSSSLNLLSNIFSLSIDVSVSPNSPINASSSNNIPFPMISNLSPSNNKIDSSSITHLNIDVQLTPPPSPKSTPSSLRSQPHDDAETDQEIAAIFSHNPSPLKNTTKWDELTKKNRQEFQEMEERLRQKSQEELELEKRIDLEFAEKRAKLEEQTKQFQQKEAEFKKKYAAPTDQTIP